MLIFTSYFKAFTLNDFLFTYNSTEFLITDPASETLFSGKFKNQVAFDRKRQKAFEVDKPFLFFGMFRREIEIDLDPFLGEIILFRKIRRKRGFWSAETSIGKIDVQLFQGYFAGIYWNGKKVARVWHNERKTYRRYYWTYNIKVSDEKFMPIVASVLLMFFTFSDSEGGRAPVHGRLFHPVEEWYEYKG